MSKRKSMNKGTAALLALSLAFLLVLPAPAAAESAEDSPGKGRLKGFIYKKDGKTPQWGIQVLLKNLETGDIFESNVTDAMGDYLVRDVPAGNYQVLLLRKDKPYKVKKADFQVKIAADKTSALSFSVKKSGKFLFFLALCDLFALLAAGAVFIII